MDSNNWRVKREPSDSPAPMRAREQDSKHQNQHQGTRWGSDRFDQRGDRYQNSFSKQDGQRDGLRKPVNDAKAEKAVEEGRRVYVGNLPYEATTKDIGTLFQHVVDGIEAINISVDPMTGRNPSYCFVDFTHSDLAREVMQEYDGYIFLGRPLKVKPGVKSGTGTGRFDVRPRYQPESNQDRNDAFSFDRWRRLEHPEDIDKAGQEGRRVHVAGLPRFDGQADANAQLRELFNGFDVKVISKMISTPEERRMHPVYHNYCFIDLSSSEEAQRAVQELNGKEPWGWLIKVSLAGGSSRKLGERRRLFVSGLPEFPSQEATEEGIRELFQGFEVSVVSKLNLPRDLSEGTNGHCFCFVEIATAEDADKAMANLDWKEMWGGNVRVKPATSNRR
ncbi:uncharacterized protein LY89DRAFT_621681 [Mollisia scopiformis]|uniref:RRM domain-containing protein n=1 Tax=Mollisia scopiformis TaxID=149040 RepID=A0A194X1U0_MOLSC|nr:uncharacterized protein LY89DRAFT_621681 [Mollisia scopiformis]KUJ13944.1 hypothetical protein LY89DRAFT_621681 [Mollisia scopiformis]